MIFDHGPYELPIATLRPREARTAARVLLGDLARWCVARWDWFRPRTVPVLVAVAGMILVLLSADYLSHAHGSAPVRVDTLTIDLQVATPPASPPIFE